MKCIRLLKLVALFGFVATADAGNASAIPQAPASPPLMSDTYTNPILPADYSDPDVVRVGDDYWLTSSSFNQVPGLPLLHSRDLVNWALEGHALDRLVPEENFKIPQQGKGVWAPAIRFHDGLYRIYYPDPDFGIYLITASDPKGPWSKPVLVCGGKGLIDPCPFWDDDGKAYLIHGWAKSRAGISNVLTLLRLDASGTKVEEDYGIIIDGNAIPEWNTLEGPKLYKISGWYYVFAPAGGVKEGWQAVFRSKSIRGPYEHRIVMDQGKTTVNGPHQGALVDTPGGEWWFLHFQDKDAYGRVVHLQPVVWHDGWPVIGNNPSGSGKGEPVMVFQKPALPVQPAAKPPTSDRFDSKKLGVQWQWQANPDKVWWSLTDHPGWLTLYPSTASVPNLWASPSLLLQKFPAETFTATVELSFSSATPGERAGLVVFGADYACLVMTKGKEGFVISEVVCLGANQGKSEEVKATVPVPFGKAWFQVNVLPGALCHFSYSTDGKNYLPLGNPFTAQPGRWVGAKVGLFTDRSGSGEKGNSRFRFFQVTIP